MDNGKFSIESDRAQYRFGWVNQEKYDFVFSFYKKWYIIGND